jgi:hypothetical protein
VVNGNESYEGRWTLPTKRCLKKGSNILFGGGLGNAKAIHSDRNTGQGGKRYANGIGLPGLGHNGGSLNRSGVNGVGQLRKVKRSSSGCRLRLRVGRV